MTRQNANWEDSGFDCDHCGGEVLARSEKSGLKANKMYLCSQCGCRWASSGRLMKVGNGPFCASSNTQTPPRIDKRVWWILGVGILLLGLFRFGGFAVLSFGLTFVRFLIPLGILALIGMAIYYVGRQMGFWE